MARQTTNQPKSKHQRGRSKAGDERGDWNKVKKAAGTGFITFVCTALKNPKTFHYLFVKVPQWIGALHDWFTS